MKQLYKISLLLILISLISCVDKDEEVISTQDLLLGRWKTIQMKVNNQIQSLDICDYQGTMEFTSTNIVFTDYLYDETADGCILDEEYSFPYTFVEDNIFKVYRSGGLIVSTEIIDLNTNTLILRSLVNNATVIKEATYKRIE